MASSDALAAVFEHIETNRVAFLDRLVAYLRHPRISAENIGIAEVGALLVDMLTDIGLETSLVPTAGHPMVVARWEKAPSARIGVGVELLPLSPRRVGVALADRRNHGRRDRRSDAGTVIGF